MVEPTAAPADALADQRLLLLAQEADEVPTISALLQDAAVRVDEIAYDARGRRLVLLASRYRWEAGEPSRARTALRIENVARAQRKEWTGGADAVLDLLALTIDGDALVLSFAAGPTIRVEVDAIDVILEDLSAPWATARKPEHVGV